MKKSLVLLLALISLFYYAGNAQAALLVEPFAGMDFNSTVDANGTDGDITGTTVGARLGFQNMGFMLGLDGRRMSWNFEPDTGADDDYTFTQLGLFVGYDFPMMLRLWGNYVFSLEGDDDDSDTKLKEGSGLAFGIGYKVVPFVSLNFEISNTKTAKIDNGTVEVDADYKYSSYLLSVSFPISI